MRDEIKYHHHHHEIDFEIYVYLLIYTPNIVNKIEENP